MNTRSRYDLIVIGGGAGGISATAAAAGLGAKTLLVESAGRLGGECSWTGCVPSKALLHIAATAHQLRGFGAAAQADRLCDRALAHTRDLTSEIARDSDSKGFLESLGAEVAYASPQLVGAQHVEINGVTVSARRVIIATGSSPRVPEIPGLASVGYLTNQELFDLDAPPKSLIILGGGPVGVEMAQAFRRLGTSVTLLTDVDRILPRDDTELSCLLADQLASEGVVLEYGIQTDRVERNGPLTRLLFSQRGQRRELEAERLLVAVGRRANVVSLGLENVSLAVDPGGLDVTPALRTGQRWLFAIGDVLGHHQFSHAAEYEARIAVQNSFFPLRTRADFRWMPWCTFSDPELAHLGLTEDELRKRGVRYKAYRWPFSRDDRARTDLKGSGLVKLLGTPRGQLLGAHILGPRAGELMNQIILGQREGASLFDLALTVNIYPTLGLALQRAADHWVGDYAATPWRKWLIRLFTRRTGKA